MLKIDNLIDNAKGYETVRHSRCRKMYTGRFTSRFSRAGHTLRFWGVMTLMKRNHMVRDYITRTTGEKRQRHDLTSGTMTRVRRGGTSTAGEK
jgi:hypothetical protein